MIIWKWLRILVSFLVEHSVERRVVKFIFCYFLAFNLMNEVDVAETEATIAKYEKENKDSIAYNQSLSYNEDRKRTYDDTVAEEERKLRHEEYVKQLEEEHKAKELEKLEIITELATTNKSAQAVIQTRQATALKRSSALRQQQSNTQDTVRSAAMPSWITASMDHDTEMRDADNFDPLQLQYEYTTGYTVRDNYVDPYVFHLV